MTLFCFFIINFENISELFLVFLLLTFYQLNISLAYLKIYGHGALKGIESVTAELNSLQCRFKVFYMENILK